MLKSFEEAQRRERRRFFVRLAVAIGSGAALFFALRWVPEWITEGWIWPLRLVAFFIVWPGLLFICEIYFQLVAVREELELQRKQFGALSAELTRRFDGPEEQAPAPVGLGVRGAHQ